MDDFASVQHHIIYSHLLYYIYRGAYLHGFVVHIFGVVLVVTSQHGYACLGNDLYLIGRFFPCMHFSNSWLEKLLLIPHILFDNVFCPLVHILNSYIIGHLLYFYLAPQAKTRCNNPKYTLVLRHRT